MFTAIRKYRVRSGTVPELARRVREGFLATLRQTEGFRGYYLLDAGPDAIVTISMFENRDQALLSNEAAANWVRNNVLEHTRGVPEVVAGDALIAETA